MAVRKGGVGEGAEVGIGVVGEEFLEDEYVWGEWRNEGEGEGKGGVEDLMGELVEADGAVGRDVF